MRRLRPSSTLTRPRSKPKRAGAYAFLFWRIRGFWWQKKKREREEAKRERASERAREEEAGAEDARDHLFFFFSVLAQISLARAPLTTAPPFFSFAPTNPLPIFIVKQIQRLAAFKRSVRLTVWEISAKLDALEARERLVRCVGSALFLLPLFVRLLFDIRFGVCFNINYVLFRCSEGQSDPHAVCS